MITDMQFSDDPSDPLNLKIQKMIEACPDHDEITELCRQIYKMGFEEGQIYVYEMRRRNIDRETTWKTVDGGGYSGTIILTPNDATEEQNLFIERVEHMKNDIAKTVKIEIEEIIKKYAEVEAEEVLRIFNEYKGKSK